SGPAKGDVHEQGDGGYIRITCPCQHRPCASAFAPRGFEDGITLQEFDSSAGGGSMAVGVITRNRSMRRRSARSTRNSNWPISMVSPRRGRRPNSCINRPPIVSYSSSEN